MSTLREWFDEFADATGERPTKIVFGEVERWRRGQWEVLAPATGEAIDFDAVPGDLLDHQFDDGFGGPECVPFYAWSKTWVLWIHEYDGSEHLRWAPRGPRKIMPSHSGHSEYEMSKP